VLCQTYTLVSLLICQNTKGTEIAYSILVEHERNLKIHFWSLDMAKRFFTTQQEAAEYLGCSGRTVGRMIREGRFPQPLYQGNGVLRKRRVWTQEQLDKVIPARKYTPRLVYEKKDMDSEYISPFVN